MQVLAVHSGTARPIVLAELRRHGEVALVDLPAGADKSTVDGVLSTVDGRRLVVLGDLAYLSGILLRLLRRGTLAGTEVAAVVDSPQWTNLVGLPRDPVTAATVAGTGEARRLGLVRDDQGGIVLSGAVLRPAAGARRFGIRAYVEDEQLVDERIRELAVHPTDTGLAATANLGWARHRTVPGRAVTVSCEPATVTVDGVERTNPRRRTTFWYDPDCWQLVR